MGAKWLSHTYAPNLYYSNSCPFSGNFSYFRPIDSSQFRKFIRSFFFFVFSFFGFNLFDWLMNTVNGGNDHWNAYLSANAK